MDCDDTFISRLEIKGEPFYVKIHWKINGNDLFHIQVLDSTSSWSGKYSLEEAKGYANEVEEDERLYQSNVRECLKNKSSKYLFDFICSNQDSNFSWKKKYEDSTAVLEYGKVSLTKDELPETKNSLIDFLLKKNKELKQVIEKSKEANANLSFELEKCKKELEAFAEMKISLESSLYSKFLQLLNAKKERIQLLEDLLKNAEKC